MIIKVDNFFALYVLRVNINQLHIAIQMFMYTDKCLGAYITTYMLQTNIKIISWAEVPMMKPTEL